MADELKKLIEKAEKIVIIDRKWEQQYGDMMTVYNSMVDVLDKIEEIIQTNNGQSYLRIYPLQYRGLEQ